jgi:hypothetical protein
VVHCPWDVWRYVHSTVLDRSLTAVQPLGHEIHQRAEILIRIPVYSTGNGDSLLFRNACTHLPLTRLHDVIHHNKIFHRGHNVRKLWELFVVRCGTERGRGPHV